MVDFDTLKYSLNLQTQWADFDDGAHGQTAGNAAGSAWHANSAGAEFDGAVLYLTKTAYTDLSMNDTTGGLAGGFDCTELPVPGETANCARGEISRYPHRGCFADVYRGDSLRVEVPFCDDGTITAKSHASYYLENVPQAMRTKNNVQVEVSGCEAALVDPVNTLKTGQASCNADESVTSFTAASGGYFNISGSHGNTNYNHADSIIGTCCVDYDGVSSSLFADNRDSYFQADSNIDDSRFREAFPSGSTAYNTYDCLGKYMFTHAEREAAFGSDKQVGNDYYGASTNADLAGFNSADTGSALGYWHKNQDYSDTFSRASVDSNGDLTSTDSNNLAAQNEWSISSDIQGYYKVVASTEVLGTQCSLRSLDATSYRRGSGSKVATSSLDGVFSQTVSS